MNERDVFINCPFSLDYQSYWLRDELLDPDVPGGHAIAKEFARFRTALPKIAGSKQLEPDELTFKDLVAISVAWIQAETFAA